jgi:hypothetical protein
MTIGVIGKDHEDVKRVVSNLSSRGYRYIALTVPTHADGFNFDAIIESSGSHLNKDLFEIKERCMLRGQWLKFANNP